MTGFIEIGAYLLIESLVMRLSLSFILFILLISCSWCVMTFVCFVAVHR